jgi:uncharacterized repeat protein (TIGR01451 family)
MKNLLLFLSISFTNLVSAQAPIIDKYMGQLNNQARAVFEENKGQIKDQNWKSRLDVLYSGSAEGMNFFIRNSGISYQLSRVESWKEEENMLHTSLGSDDKKRQIPDKISSYRVDAEWINANQDFSINQGNALEGYNNYYNVPEGIEPALFVKKYETLTLKNVWNGVDIHYFGNEGLLETDYIVAPGADYRKIQIQFKGAELSRDEKGNLIIKTPFGEIHEGALKVYQNNERIEAHWKIGKDNVVSFDIPNYNADLALRIDPLTRVWGTYYGGGDGDQALSIDNDNQGNILISGITSSNNGISSGGFQNTIQGSIDAFISKLSAQGDLIWGSYYGGAADELSYSIKFDPTGYIYISGATESSFGIAQSGHQGTYGGENFTSSSSIYGDAFLVKFDLNGFRIWGTYYGGFGGDRGYSVTTDTDGNVYMCGGTRSISGIAFNGHQSTYSHAEGISEDAFLVKFNSLGVRQWGTYYGGNGMGTEGASCVTTDYLNNVFICGGSSSTNNISFMGYQNSLGGAIDAFLVKFNSLGVRQWATYYGNYGVDGANFCATDNQGNVVICGITSSTNLLTNQSGFQGTYGGGQFDSFLTKFDSNGAPLWGTYFGGTGRDEATSCEVDEVGDIFFCGTTSSIDNIYSNGCQANYGGGNKDGFLSKINSVGNLIWSSYLGGSLDETPKGISVDLNDNVIVSGETNSVNSISYTGYQNSLEGSNDAFIVKFKQPKINGFVWNDWNANCLKETSETNLLSGVNLMIQPGNYVSQSANGIWSLDSLPIGNYTVTIDTTNLNWNSTCPINQTFTVTNPNEFTDGPNFGLISTIPCTAPEISIYAPSLTPCQQNQTAYVSACNQVAAIQSLDSTYVEVELDSLIILTAASLPYTSLGNNVFQFQTGNIASGQCVDFNITFTVNCNTVLGLTVCMEANLYPVEPCVLDTIPSDPPSAGGTGGTLGGLPQPCTLPWDQSSLSVDAWCQNDSIYFTITNSGVLGGGDMECYAPVWITVDGVLTFTDSILLVGGQTITYAFLGNGQTWILNAEQHPLHPGNSHPNAHIERCGDITNWTPDQVNDFPPDDADPIVDIYCGVVTGSYDPNDKTGFPIGQTDQFYIQPNQQLQYVIRFQNTGTDTAFTVVIRDTLDIDLNIFTVTPGVSSHNYEFRMYGPRVLEWTFNNINLPDSAANQVGSNGFVTFHVEQVPNLAPGTEINNDADIYFDFNAPITTNTTMHRIFEGFVSVAALEEMSKQETGIKVYPNPSNGQMTILLEKSADNSNYNIFDLEGKIVKTGLLSGKKNTIDTDLNSGMYFLMIGANVVKVQVVH